MANLALYIDLGAKALVQSANSTIPARLPELFQGDGLGVDLFFLTPTGDTFAPYTFNNYTAPTIRLGIGKVAAPTGGTFTITDTTSGSTTAAIAYNASAAAIVSAFAGIGRTVSVTGDYLTGYVIQFLAGTNFAQITASAANLTPDCVAIIKTVRQGASGISEVQTLKFQQLAGAYVDSWTPKLGSTPTATPSTISSGNGAATTTTPSTVQEGNGSSVREIQRVTFGAAPVAGSFFLTFSGYGNTASIPYDASAATIQDTINALLGAGVVTVTLVPGVSFDITWASTFANQTQCTATSALVTGTTHEVQRVTFSTPSAGGSFSLGFAAGNTDSIDWNASAADIAAAINALLGDGAVSVTVVNGVSFDVTWADYTNHAQLTINTAALQWPYGFTGTLNLDTLGIDQMLGDSASVTDAILEVELTPSGGTPETVLQENVTVTNDLLESSVYGSTPNPTSDAYQLITTTDTVRAGVTRVRMTSTPLGVTITVPSASAYLPGTGFDIVDETTAANISFARAGTDLINTATSVTYTGGSNRRFLQFRSNGSNSWSFSIAQQANTSAASWTGTTAAGTPGPQTSALPLALGGTGGTTAAAARTSLGVISADRQTQTLAVAASSITFNVPSGYKSLRLLLFGRTSAAGSTEDVLIRFNSDSGANYQRRYTLAESGSTVSTGSNSGATALAGFVLPGTGATAGIPGNAIMCLVGYENTTFQKVARCESNAMVSGPQMVEVAGIWASTSAVATITLTTGSGANFVAGTEATLICE